MKIELVQMSASVWHGIFMHADDTQFSFFYDTLQYDIEILDGHQTTQAERALICSEALSKAGPSANAKMQMIDTIGMLLAEPVET